MARAATCMLRPTRPSRDLSFMTPTAIDASPPRAVDLRVIGLVGSAHFVSHVYILASAAGVPVRARGIRRQLYRARIRGRGVQHRLRAAADAGRLSGRPDIGAHGAGRRPAARRGLAGGRGRGAGLPAARRHVRVPRARQHRLSPGRLCAAVEPGLAGPHRAGVFDPHLCGLHRLGDHAGGDGDPRQHARLARAPS